MLNVNIGGWKNWHKVSEQAKKGWEVLDIVGQPKYRHNLNSGEPFPLRDNEVDNYYTSETLEHVYMEEFPFVFGEIKRTLKLGGRIRIVVPDVEIFIRAYVNSDNVFFMRHAKERDNNPFPKTTLGYLMTCFYSVGPKYVRGKPSRRSGHNTAFDYNSMVWWLGKNGFKDIHRKQYNICSPVYNGLDFARYKDTSLYMEAVNGK